MKERPQIIFPELLFLSYNKSTPQIVIANINNISCTDFINSSKENILFVQVSVCCRRAKNGYTKYDASCTITSLATKTRRSICTRPTATKVFDKLSRAAFAKHTSYNWRNGEATYLVLLTRYCLFDIQRNIFHCKTHFAWYEISVYFLFFVIYAISDLLKNNSFKLKISVNVLNFQNSTLGLKFGYISYQMSFKKSMIGLK